MRLVQKSKDRESLQPVTLKERSLKSQGGSVTLLPEGFLEKRRVCSGCVRKLRCRATKGKGHACRKSWTRGKIQEKCRGKEFGRGRKSRSCLRG